MAESPKPQWDILFENESNEPRYQNKEYIYPYVKKSKLEHFCDVLINIPLGLEQANNDFLFGCKDLILHPPSLKQIAIGFLHSPDAIRGWVEKFSVVSPGEKSRMLSKCVGDIALFWAGEEFVKLGVDAKKISEFRKLSKLADKSVKTGKYSEWVTSLSKTEKLILNDSFKKPIEWLVKSERNNLVSQIKSRAGGSIKNIPKNVIKNTEEFVKSATKSDRNGLSKVGRGLQKHSSRKNSAFKDVKFSHKNADQIGEKVLREIIESPNKVIEYQPNGTQFIYDSITKRGFNVSREGIFNGFREYNKISK